MSSPCTPVTRMLARERLCFRSEESPNVINDKSDVDALRSFTGVS